MQCKTGEAPVYRYEFDDAPPLAADAKPGQVPTAHHAAEIEFVFEMLSSKNLPWRAEDRRISDLMSSYWTNFAKTGDPNGPGLPQWPEYNRGSDSPVMHFAAERTARDAFAGGRKHSRPAALCAMCTEVSRALPAQHRARYEFLDTRWAQK
jgi:para-nitrobenzyl esterase